MSKKEKAREKTRKRLSRLLSLASLHMHADKDELDAFIDALLAELEPRLR